MWTSVSPWAEAKRLAVEPEGDLRLDAIFCHADVVGASMNESVQARDGIDPGLFAVAVVGLCK